MSSWRSIPTQDRISNLPEELICHILSFIPTKLAVATSVLSKRWTSLWRSVLTLIFDKETFKNYATFSNCIDSIIESRDATLPLLSFHIKCGYSRAFIPSDLNRFVQAALQRGVQNLNIKLSSQFYDPLALSVFSLFTSRTLVVLKLNNLEIRHIPQSVHLPLLKTLNLVSIIFMTDYLDFKRFFYGCPILENLNTNGLHTPYMPSSSSERDYKVFSKLVRADLFDFPSDLSLAWTHNVKFLRVELLGAYGSQIPAFHNLIHMELIFNTDFGNYVWTGKWEWVIQVLQHCPKLQNLTIDKASRYSSLHWDKVWEHPKTVPKCLSSQLRTCSLKGYGYTDIECELQFAEYIMLNSKLLCIMTIKSSPLVRKKAKDQMLVRLLSCPRGSATCKLLVD